MGYRARKESQKRAWEPCTVRKSCLQREKPIVAAGKQFFLSSRPPGHTRRVSTRRGWAAAHSSAAFIWCTRVALAIRRFRAGISRSAERGSGRAAPALGQKGRDTYGFPPSLNSYLSLSSLANEPYGSTS